MTQTVAIVAAEGDGAGANGDGAEADDEGA